MSFLGGIKAILGYPLDYYVGFPVWVGILTMLSLTVVYRRLKFKIRDVLGNSPCPCATFIVLGSGMMNLIDFNCSSLYEMSDHTKNAFFDLFCIHRRSHKGDGKASGETLPRSFFSPLLYFWKDRRDELEKNSSLRRGA